ncbi:MAG: sulfatase-like hydrolase/transferase, partial [Planctomicrobium sp.]|nr:sulfatase-like hydrolase/transferase [Planctomicrobium sp.]
MTSVASAQEKPNILIIWGDDIGTWNISHNNRGMMGYKTPNIDRIAREGISFTDYYGQQSCTAGRAAFLNGSVPVRTGMTKVGMPNAPQGWQKSDVTFATVLKAQGYTTGQFGKNHQGDRDEHLPTVNGFDEFMGNLYHLNAEEEPENRDYPRDLKLANGKTFLEQFGPRGVIKSKADGKGGQTIEDTGPLTKKRMETIDEETLAAAKDFIKRKQNGDEPWMCWWNATRMHFRTHVKEEHKNLAG